MPEDSGIDAEEVMVAEFVGSIKAAEVIEHIRFSRTSLLQQMEFGVLLVLYAAMVAGRLAPVVDTETVVRRNSELAVLYGSEESAAITLVVDIETWGDGPTFGNGFGEGDDVEDTRYAFGIVFRSGVGDDFDFLYGRSGVRLEDFLWIVSHHLVGFAVDIDLESALAVHLDVVFAVNGHHRHLPQHLGEGLCCGLRIVGDRVDHFVNFSLYGAFLCRHTGFAEYNLKGVMGSLDGVELFVGDTELCGSLSCQRQQDKQD